MLFGWWGNVQKWTQYALKMCVHVTTIVNMRIDPWPVGQSIYIEMNAITRINHVKVAETELAGLGRGGGGGYADCSVMRGRARKWSSRGSGNRRREQPAKNSHVGIEGIHNFSSFLLLIVTIFEKFAYHYCITFFFFYSKFFYSFFCIDQYKILKNFKYCFISIISLVSFIALLKNNSLLKVFQSNLR